MKLLAFDASTETLTVALTRPVDGIWQVWEYCGAGGAQASTSLIANIFALLRRAGIQLQELDAIAFGQGPGSFTGLRCACSVAQGLGFGARVPLLPVDTLLAVAEEARYLYGEGATEFSVLALLDARMDEVYAASFGFQSGRWMCLQEQRLVAPQDLPAAPLLAGNAFTVYGDRLHCSPGARRLEALPTATAMLRLAPALLAGGSAVLPERAWPLYIRDKVAKTTLERAAQAL